MLVTLIRTYTVGHLESSVRFFFFLFTISQITVTEMETVIYCYKYL